MFLCILAVLNGWTVLCFYDFCTSVFNKEGTPFSYNNQFQMHIAKGGGTCTHNKEFHCHEWGWEMSVGKDVHCKVGLLHTAC